MGIADTEEATAEVIGRTSFGTATVSSVTDIWSYRSWDFRRVPTILGVGMSADAAGKGPRRLPIGRIVALYLFFDKATASWAPS